MKRALVGLAVLLALALGFLGLRRSLSPRMPRRPAPRAGAREAGAAASGELTGSETETAVSSLPAVKISAARGGRSRRRPVVSPVPLP